MAFQDSNNGGGGFQPRQKFQGNWKCAQCGTDITELPFEPDPARMNRLACRDCYRQRRPAPRRDNRY